MTSYLVLPWRTGRKVGRTIYAHRATEPSDEDPLIGVMDTPELAADIVKRHNEVFGGDTGIVDLLNALRPVAEKLRAGVPRPSYGQTPPEYMRSEGIHRLADALDQVADDSRKPAL